MRSCAAAGLGGNSGLFELHIYSLVGGHSQLHFVPLTTIPWGLLHVGEHCNLIFQWLS